MAMSAMKPNSKIHTGSLSTPLTRRQVIVAGVSVAAFAVTGRESLLALCQATPSRPGEITLVSWVQVKDPESRGGSVLTLGNGDQFDGIVFGEIAPHRWMAGSELYHRTQMNQDSWPTETAGADEWIQVALVYRDNTITMFRDGKELWSYRAASAPIAFGKGEYAMFGWRHQGAGGPGGFFHGAIRDARIYASALTGADLTALKPGQKSAVEPYAWWDFARGATDRMSRLHHSEFVGGAHIEKGALVLNGVDGYLSTDKAPQAIRRGQFRPSRGVFADPIPFYWKGQYHVFYLQGGVGKVPWQHIVSTNLVDWKELPTALVSDGDPHSFDGMHMFTGSVAELDGTFYIFYTGWNPNNPLGRESILHATSPDLIHWTKVPGQRVDPDGVTYSNRQDRDFRDAFVFRNEKEQTYWMVLCANSLKGGGPGLYTSKDMAAWAPEHALLAPNQECPDLFQIGGTWYLIGGDSYRYSGDPRGEFKAAVHNVIDRPGVYAGKRMFDGRRHIWVGWIWDTSDKHDSEQATWGGTMSLPRELYPGPDGVLFVRPAQEVVNVFQKQRLKLSQARPLTLPSGWTFDGKSLEGKSRDLGESGLALVGAPLEGMFEINVNMAANTEFTILFRFDEAKKDGYAYTLRPQQNQVVVSGSNIHRVREGVVIDTSKPVRIRAFLLGTTIELFINDQYAFTRRAYDFSGDKIAFRVDSGRATVTELLVKSMKS